MSKKVKQSDEVKGVKVTLVTPKADKVVKKEEFYFSQYGVWATDLQDAKAKAKKLNKVIKLN